MGVDQIVDVDVVADTRSVRRVVVGAEDRDAVALPEPTSIQSYAQPAHSEQSSKTSQKPRTIERVAAPQHSTAVGAALTGLVATGQLADIAAAGSCVGVDRHFEPSTSSDRIDAADRAFRRLPRLLSKFHRTLDEPVAFPIEELIDWAHFQEGRFDGPHEGGFTIALLRQRYGQAGPDGGE